MSSRLLTPAPAAYDRSDRSENHRSLRLRRYLSAYWLRPENALWMALRSEALAGIAWTRPSLDLCCGDGVFTFLHLEGELDFDFDVFLAVGRLDRVRDDHADMFDHTDENYRPAVVAGPSESVDAGTDLKPALLSKAGRLNLYDRLVEHDANQPLPFEDNTFETVYGNAVYWVKNIHGLLTELGRITKPGGRIILQVKLESMRRYNLDAYRDRLGTRFLEIIGRGRLACWPTLADRLTWERRFREAGLTLLEATPFVTRTHAHLWDVGLRPIAPLLVKMVQSINPQTRSAIKREWVDLFLELLVPFSDPNMDLMGGDNAPAEIQYVLSPKGKT